MNRSTIFWGALLTLFGVLLLLNNFGVFGHVNIWGIIGPLFIISFGVWLVLSMVLPGPKDEKITIPVENFKRARIRIGHAAGRLKITAGVDPLNLVDGICAGGLQKEIRRETDMIDVHLSVPAQSFPGFIGPGQMDWSLALNPTVSLNLIVESGANEAVLDLQKLQVTDLQINTGASSTTVILPESSALTTAQVKSGAAAVNIVIPTGVAARIRTSSGLAAVSVATVRFPRSADGYQSPDYESAANKVDLKIETGVGAVDVR